MGEGGRRLILLSSIEENLLELMVYVITTQLLCDVGWWLCWWVVYYLHILGNGRVREQG